MSDLANLAKLARSDAQLPVTVYFDESLLKQEIQQLFHRGPRYAGHELMVPNAGDFATLAWENEGRVLVRGPDTPDGSGPIELLSNVCRHRQAKMLNGRGNATNIVCPLHRWTYDLKGELLGAPRFAENPCVKLQSTPLTRWNGLLFAGPGNPLEELADFGCSEDFDFSGYVLDRVESTDYATNWKTFVEVYLEVYHVDFLHAGLGNFADCNNFHVRYGECNSVQVMTAKKGLTAPGTPVYRRWQDACLKQLRGKTPKYGALWATYLPGLTLEWYPNVLIVSNLIPRSPGLTTNVVEFYYPEEIVHFERDFIEAQKAAYAETALEDDEICRRLDRGRRALWQQGLDDAGPYQSPMEDTMVHFHEWLRRGLEGK